MPELLTIVDVLARTRISRRRYFQLRHDGKFPPAFYFGARAVAHRSDDIDAWIIQRAIARRQHRDP